MKPRQIDLETLTDLELIEFQGQVYQQLIQSQTNLQAIQNEIQRRKSTQKVADKIIKESKDKQGGEKPDNKEITEKEAPKVESVDKK